MRRVLSVLVLMGCLWPARPVAAQTTFVSALKVCFPQAAPTLGIEQDDANTLKVTDCANTPTIKSWHVKNLTLDGTCIGCPGAGNASAKYVLQQPDSTLPNAQALSALASGLMVATTTTGLISTVTGPSGAIVGTTDTQTLTHKTLDDSTTAAFKALDFTLEDGTDPSKVLAFSLAGLTTATTRTLTVPDVSGTLTVLGNASTGSGSVVLATSPALTTPTIASFANATHTHQNAAGGGQLSEGALTLSDVTTGNATTLAHGFLSKLPGGTTTFLRADGSFASVPSAPASSLAFPTNGTLQQDTTNQYGLRCSGSGDCYWRIFQTYNTGTSSTDQVLEFKARPTTGASTITVKTGDGSTYSPLSLNASYISLAEDTTALVIVGDSGAGKMVTARQDTPWRLGADPVSGPWYVGWKNASTVSGEHILGLTDGADIPSAGTGTVMIGETAAAPTCDAAHRGTFWPLRSGAGVADTLQFCAKNSSDAYIWVSVVTVP